MARCDAVTTASARPRVLWVTSEIDLPPRGGAAIYSQGLMHALSRQRFLVTALGVSAANLPQDDAVVWKLLNVRRRHAVRRLTSLYPLMTARLPLRQLRDALNSEIMDGYDLAIIDHLMASWSVGPLIQARRRGLVGQIWYMSQNDEGAIWRVALSSSGEQGFHRIARAIDYPLVRRAQRRLVRSASLVTTITEQDATIHRSLGATRVEVARPGPPPVGAKALPPARHRPRTLIVAGSYLWRIKLRNLAALLRASRDITRSYEVNLLVAGRMREKDQSLLSRRYPWADIRGEVDDMQTVYREGRLGVVPETLGGGFKLKVLDFVYNGLAVAGLRSAMAGLPMEPGIEYISAAGVSDLIHAGCVAVDDPDALDAMAKKARLACDDRFDWDATGGDMAQWFSELRDRADGSAEERQ